MDLSGEIVLITGASSGIGKATAKLLGANGAKVVLLARSLDRLEAVATESGPSALPLRCDVTVLADVEECVGAAVGHFGRLTSSLLTLVSICRVTSRTALRRRGPN